MHQVWDFVISPENTPKWIDGIAVEERNEEPTRLGTIYRNRGDNETWTEYKITEIVPASEFVLSRADGYHVRYTLRLVDNDDTELEYHEWMDEGKLTDPFTQATLEKLKVVMETHKRYKAFLFDYDGVITAGVKDNTPAIKLAKNLGTSVEKAADWIVSIWDGLSTGKLTEQEAWQKIEEQYGQPISLEQRDIWYTWKDLKPLPEMLELVRNLKDRGYAVGLLSNVLPITSRLIRQNGVYDEFDFTVLSCEIGARKPAPLMYETALIKLGNVRPDEVVYLDDREPLTLAASKLGIRTIYVTEHAEAIKEAYRLIEK